MFRSYLRLLLFTLGLLLGVQVPGFIDDYAKRVDAHRLEAAQNIQASSRPPGSSSTVAWRNWSGITAATAIRCSSATARTSTA